jgi:hypothetical protein
MTILDATASPRIPGAQFGISFGDSGFKSVFKDPWPGSRNQVGHFLTAVGLSFNAGQVSSWFYFRRIRDWVGAPLSLSDEEVAIRLCIGHEKLADNHGYTNIGTIQAQFAAATSADVQAFRQAGVILGAGPRLHLRAALTWLYRIRVNWFLSGNSYEDLLLTLCGWRLGRMIKKGRFKTGAGVAHWIRENIAQ